METKTPYVVVEIMGFFFLELIFSQARKTATGRPRRCNFVVHYLGAPGATCTKYGGDPGPVIAFIPSFFSHIYAIDGLPVSTSKTTATSEPKEVS